MLYVISNDPTECEAGQYGAECGQTCTVHCAGEGKPCDHISGQCTNGCEPGYTGERCTQGKFNKLVSPISERKYKPNLQ